MSPLSILHVAPYAPEAWAYGGIPRVVGGLTRSLAARGHRVALLTTDAGDERHRLEAGRGMIDGVERRVCRNVSNHLAHRFQLFLPIGIGRALDGDLDRFDVAHLHACHNVPAALAARCLARRGVPYLVTPNGTAGRIERRRGAKWLFDRTVGRRLLPGAARVLAVSSSEATALARLGIPEERLLPLPNPVAVDELGDPTSTPTRDWDRMADRPFVLFLGRITPRKHLATLVEAVARLPSSVALAVAGRDGGGGAAARVAVRRTGMGHRVEWLGLLTGRERAPWLARAAVVAYPSADEAFGLAPLEALACGTPVVVGADAGCGELVRGLGGGRLVRPGDPTELVRALAAILDDPDARRRAREAGREVRRRYAPEVVATRLEAIYRRVIEEASS